MVLQQKPLEEADFIVKITGPVMVRPASSDKWKAPLDEGPEGGVGSHFPVPFYEKSHSHLGFFSKFPLAFQM